MIFIDDSEQEPDKIIYIQRNGDHHSKKISKVVLKSGITFLDIQIKVQRDLKLGYVEKFRLFNREGVEIFENDLPFLQNNYNLLASMGEDYDSSTGFSEYQILNTIGEGGFGKVVLAEHKATKEKVAIKFVNTSLIGNASDIDMVFREAEVLKNLSHRNIVKIYNCYTLKGMEVVFIMEYLQGGELLDYVTKKGKLSELEARSFFRQMVDAIQYCHKENVIHRDLKLENILLLQSHSSIIKIIDFGIAGVGNLNTNKLNVGSLRYMAPEVLLKQVQSLQKSIDIWSLGVILYTLVCGLLPFNGETPQEIIKKITSGNFSFPIQMEGMLTDEIKDLIQNILITDPNQRFSLKQIRQHEWMKLPTVYLYEQQQFIQQKLEQMQNYALKYKDKNRIKFGLLNTSREQTLRGITGGYSKNQNVDSPSNNRTKEQRSPYFSLSPSPSPLGREQTKQAMLKEMTSQRFPSPQKLGSKFGIRENSQGLREMTRMGGMKSPMGTPTKSIMVQRKLQGQFQNSSAASLLDKQSQFKDFTEDFKDEDEYYSKQNAVEEQINEIKRVLGLQVAPVKSHLNTQQLISLPPLQQNNSSTSSSQLVSQNGVKVVKRGSKEILENQSIDIIKQSESQFSSNNGISSILDNKRTSIETNQLLSKHEGLADSQREDKTNQIKDPKMATIVQTSENRIAGENEEKKERKKEEPYYRLVYMLRQRKQEENQGDPHLQINKDFGGIYIPKQIGFIAYTANTNLRTLQTSPTRFSRKYVYSPPRKKSLSPPKQQGETDNKNIFSPQNIFLKKPLTTVKYSKVDKLNASYN